MPEGLQTSAVHSFSLYVVLRADRDLDDAAVDAVAGPLRPDAPDLCIWRDPYRAALLRISVECLATDLEAALAQGHALAEETRALGRGLTVEEVVAMTEQEQLVWRSRP